jgi:DNA-binding MarR family transcriptional regulator
VKISQEHVIRALPREGSISAQNLAQALGLEPRDVVPVLNSARDDGQAQRLSASDEGHVQWRRP